MSAVLEPLAPDDEELDASDPVEIELPEPHALQLGLLDDPARFKCAALGRRTGKDRVALVAAVAGHGSATDSGEPSRKGVLHGGDVVWVAPDYPQAATIWNEEVRPRFANLAGVRCRENDLTVDFWNGYGRLVVRSAENVDSIRGMGKRLNGVIVNEAAHLDLRYAWRSVIRPALSDRKGWAMFLSTTNSGEDGGIDEQGHKLAPSFFNVLCDEVRRGVRGPAWAFFAGDARSNPYIPPDEFAELVAEYVPGSLSLREEVYAELILQGGRPLCLPYLDKRHVIPAFKVPSHWPQFGAFDWGYAHNAVFGWFTVDEDGTIYVLDTVWMHRKLPKEQTRTIKERVPVGALDYVDAGHDLWHEHKARGENAPTLFEQFQSEGIVCRRANIDRTNGLNNLRHYVAWEGMGPDGDDADPRLFFCDTPGNRRLFAQCQTIRTDERDAEKPEILNANPSDGSGGDDGFSMLRYGVASRPWNAKQLVREMNRSAWHPANLAAEAALRRDGGSQQKLLRKHRERTTGFVGGDGMVV